MIRLFLTALLICMSASPASGAAQLPAAGTAVRWGLTPHDLATLSGVQLFRKAGAAANFAALRVAAEGGDVMAMTLVAIAYLDGTGVTADAAEARRWAERAAEAGDARAFRTLGSIRAHGVGLPVDLPAAFALFERAYRGGNLLAAADMGSLLYNGEGGIAQDRARAFTLLREAAEAGVLHANGGLALAYVNGDGTARDLLAARQAAWRGAMAGDGLSQHVLAAIHGSGLGVERDRERADGWLQTAALDGSPEALAELGWSRETLALVRRWGPYARLTNRRLNNGDHFFRYTWREPGRVLVMTYGNLADMGELDADFTWADGAVAPVSDNGEWRIRSIGGELFEEVGEHLYRMIPSAGSVIRMRYRRGPDGAPGELRDSLPLATIPLGEYNRLVEARAARDSAPQQAPAQSQPAGDH